MSAPPAVSIREAILPEYTPGCCTHLAKQSEYVAGEAALTAEHELDAECMDPVHYVDLFRR